MSQSANTIMAKLVEALHSVHHLATAGGAGAWPGRTLDVIAAETARVIAAYDSALQADPVAVAVALIIHHAEKLTRMEITEEGMFLGVGTHKLYTAPPAAALVPDDVLQAVDRMSMPLDMSHGIGKATTDADARCMQTIADFIHGLAAAPSPAAEAPAKCAQEDYYGRYLQLILAVGNKHPGESRHETALRYIRQAEQISQGDDADLSLQDRTL